MVELTEQLQELQKSGWPPRILNPRTQQTYVLLHVEMFNRVLRLLQDEDEIATVEEMYPLVNEVLDTDEASSRVLIDPKTLDGRTSGLSNLSAVKCENLFTISQARVKDAR